MEFDRSPLFLEFIFAPIGDADDASEGAELTSQLVDCRSSEVAHAPEVGTEELTGDHFVIGSPVRLVTFDMLDEEILDEYGILGWYRMDDI